jgi:hypothetical protein
MFFFALFGCRSYHVAFVVIVVTYTILQEYQPQLRKNDKSHSAGASSLLLALPNSNIFSQDLSKVNGTNIPAAASIYNIANSNQCVSSLAMCFNVSK